MTRYLPANPFAKAGIFLLLAVGTIYAVTIITRPRPFEANRVVAAAGYSIIRPEGWSADMRRPFGPTAVGPALYRDFINIAPDRYIGIPPKIFVRRLTARIDPIKLTDGGWTPGEFQGEKAMLLQKRFKRWLYREAMFERGGKWFEVGELLPNAESIRTDEWWRFVETFRYPEPGVTPPPDLVPTSASTAPSTEPFALPVQGEE